MENRATLLESLLFVLCLAAFGWWSQVYLPGGLLCLLASAIIMGRHLTGRRAVASLLALSFPKEKRWEGLLLGLLTGLFAVLAYFFFDSHPFVFPQLTRFAWTAAAVGLTEELVFRGFLQSRVQAYGPAFAVVFSTLGHTLYKVAIFIPHPQIAIEGVAVWTIVAGLVLGVLRVRYRSVWPAALNHVVFDVLVYGGAAGGLWWVW